MTAEAPVAASLLLRRRILPRTEPCACGGWLTVNEPDRARAVRFEVQRHNATNQHRAWRARAGL